jgi:hypothetical protein
MNREAQHVYDLIIKPTLPMIGLDSPSARILMVCTGQVETAFDHLRQVLPNGHYGPGYGWWSQQENSYAQNVRYLSKEPKLKARILSTCYLDLMPNFDALIWNLRFACAMARLHYWQYKEPLPAADDLEGMGKYWLRYYNKGGKGTLDRFMAECKDLVVL